MTTVWTMAVFNVCVCVVAFSSWMEKNIFTEDENIEQKEHGWLQHVTFLKHFLTLNSFEFCLPCNTFLSFPLHPVFRSQKCFKKKCAAYLSEQRELL